MTFGRAHTGAVGVGLGVISCAPQVVPNAANVPIAVLTTIAARPAPWCMPLFFPVGPLPTANAPGETSARRAE